MLGLFNIVGSASRRVEGRRGSEGRSRSLLCVRRGYPSFDEIPHSCSFAEVECLRTDGTIGNEVGFVDREGDGRTGKTTNEEEESRSRKWICVRSRLAEGMRPRDSIERPPIVREPAEDLVGEVKAEESRIAGRDGKTPFEEEADCVGREVGTLDVEISCESFDRVGERKCADSIEREHEVCSVRSGTTCFDG